MADWGTFSSNKATTNWPVIYCPTMRPVGGARANKPPRGGKLWFETTVVFPDGIRLCSRLKVELPVRADNPLPYKTTFGRGGGGGLVPRARVSSRRDQGYCMLAGGCEETQASRRKERAPVKASPAATCPCPRCQKDLIRTEPLKQSKFAYSGRHYGWHTNLEGRNGEGQGAETKPLGPSQGLLCR